MLIFLLKLVITDLLLLYFFRFYNLFKFGNLDKKTNKIHFLLSSILNIIWFSWIFAKMFFKAFRINIVTIFFIVLLTILLFINYFLRHNLILQRKEETVTRKYK